MYSPAGINGGARDLSIVAFFRQYVPIGNGNVKLAKPAKSLIPR